MTFRPTLALTAVAGLALIPAGAIAAKPPKTPKGGTAITIGAKPNPVVFTKTVTISGRLTAPTAGGVGVTLEQDTTVPLGDKFTAVGTPSKTAANGSYQFVLKPAVNTMYRVVAKTTPDVTSPNRLVSVRPLVGLKVSDSTPARGALVRFSGSVYPAHDGSSVSIQKRSSAGRWTTVARTTLRDAGTTRSSYAKRIRVRTSGTYRVKLVGHSDHVNGFSALRTLNVG